MNMQFGKGKIEYGTGVQIYLTGDEVATVIDKTYHYSKVKPDSTTMKRKHSTFL